MAQNIFLEKGAISQNPKKVQNPIRKNYHFSIHNNESTVCGPKIDMWPRNRLL